MGPEGTQGGRGLPPHAKGGVGSGLGAAGCLVCPGMPAPARASAQRRKNARKGSCRVGTSLRVRSRARAKGGGGAAALPGEGGPGGVAAQGHWAR